MRKTAGHVIASNSSAAVRLLAALFLLCHCSENPPSTSDGGGGAGGEDAQAGMSSVDGGVPSTDGGAAGNTSGGTNSAGSGGSETGGSGGTESGGSSSAGQGNAGTAPIGGAGAGGTGFDKFMLGADISSLPESLDDGDLFVDTDGMEKDLITLLGNHGFNYIRLRSFVDPNALYGYANPNGEAQYVKDEPYCDTAHTLEVAQQAKQAGMGFLLDLHYSDNWADPGKQVIPAAWRSATTVAQLANHVKTYTTTVVSELVAGGARPDIVQIGNEITPGLLIHIPGQDPDADQWGNMNKAINAVNGQAGASNWNNVATLLKAGIDGVKAVDPSIKIMLHLENTTSFPAVRDWVNAVRSRGVELDVLGLSCYPAFQGQPSVWKDTFEQLTEQLDDISFVIAEYNPEATEANEIMAGLPDGRGLGTFFWEPTQSGSWGASLFVRNGDTLEANPTRFAEFDALKISLGL